MNKQECAVELVRRILLGDEAACQELFDLYKNYVYGYVRWLCENRAKHLLPPFMIEDIVEESVSYGFQRAFEQAAKYDPSRASVRVWITSIAKYRMLSLLSKALKEQNRYVPLPGPGDEDEDQLLAIADQTADRDPTLDEVLSAEMKHHVQQIIKSLAPRQRTAITLFMKGHRTGDIADAENISYEAAESLLRRAKASFKKKWLDEPW